MLARSWTYLLGCLLFFTLVPVSSAEKTSSKRPNVLMIVIDDLNDWVGCLGGHPQVKTPHIDRLAKKGMLFTNAHCQAPICTPSRNSVLSGKLPSTTGCYDLSQTYDRSKSLAGVTSMPEYFAKRGYITIGGGKVFHGSGKGKFQIHLKGSRGGPRPNKRMHWKTAVWDWGPFPARDEQMGDYQLAKNAAGALQEKRDRPFFMAVGFFRPHVPLHVPPKWFAAYDVNKIVLPKAPPEDLKDLPKAALDQPNNVAPRHAEMLKKDRWRSIVQAYLASISFADSCVGEVLEGLEKGPHRDNTIIILWSDHGFHLGEKHHWAKRTLWEESTRVPLIFAGPQVLPCSLCRRPVGLIDLYPTLLKMCDLPLREGLEGKSLTPLLADPQAKWDRPVITTFLRNNHAIRNQHWRYIRYADGSQELYDHRTDPNEWHNLAGNPKYANYMRELSVWLPEVNAEPTANVKRTPRKYDEQ